MTEQELTHRQSRLRELEDELQERYRSIGKRMVELAEREQRDIDRITDEIIATRKSINKSMGV